MSQFDALQEQYNKERMNEQVYASFAAVLEAANWPGFSAWFADQSSQERDHSKKFRDYLIDRNQVPMLTALDAPRSFDGNDPRPLFQAALNLERENTASILALEELAESLDDGQTEDWIIWAVNEQTASERELVDAILEINRVDNTGLLILDREYGEKVAG
jgi:ferritin